MQADPGSLVHMHTVQLPKLDRRAHRTLGDCSEPPPKRRRCFRLPRLDARAALRAATDVALNELARIRDATPTPYARQIRCRALKMRPARFSAEPCVQATNEALI